MRVEAHLVGSAGRFPGKTAIVAGSTRLAYRDLDRLSSGFAAGLAAHGIGPGDRVLVFLNNCVEAAIAIYGIMKAGAVFSPVNASTKASKLAYIIDNCRAAAVVTKTRLTPIVAGALSEANTRPLTIVAGRGSSILPDALGFEALAQTAPAPVPHGLGEEALAMLIYTSGSTGHPKGVMMTHANIDAASRAITTYLENTSDDIILNVLPLAFDYGLYQLLMAVRMGATLVLEKSFAFPQAIFETMRREKVTGLPLVPTMAAMILDIDGLEGTFPDLRYVTNTAAALPPAHIARLQKLLPTTTIFSMYGLTECKRCTWLPPARLADKPGSVGIAIPGTEAYVVGDAGEKLPAGITGELVIRGPHVMQGYWENPEATHRALRPGPIPGEKVLYTGDLFYADAEGFLYFVGRKDDIIKTRGEKVAPKEVEAVLAAHEGIGEAIVVGRDDPVLGQAICALVVRRDPDLSEREVIAHCAKHLEDFMVPRRVEFRDSLPKTETGKLSRRLAAESLA